MKACFAKLAISLYLNESPFNPIVLPTMCRVFKETEKNFKLNSMLKSLGTVQSTLEKEKETFINLIEESLEFLKIETHNVTFKIWENELILYVLQILYILIRTNVFEYLNKNSYYVELMECLVKILNFDGNKKESTLNCEKKLNEIKLILFRKKTA